MHEFRFRTFGSPMFSAGNCLLLCATGFAADAEQYVVERREAVEGSDYHRVLPLASNPEAERLYLAAAVLHRALLESVLDAALYGGYSHAATYLHKLCEIAPLVDAWQSIQPHAAYEAAIRSSHARKVAFWERVAEVAAKAGQKVRRSAKKQGVDSDER